MFGVARHVGNGHLVGTEGAFDRQAVHHLRAGPTLGRAQDDRRPTGPAGEAVGTGLLLDRTDAGIAGVEGGRKHLVNLRWVIAFDEVHVVTMPLDDAANGSVSGAAEHGGATDL